jgi:hypothetical protein
MCECCKDEKPKPPPSRVPAYELWVEVSTRIAEQDLHFRSGKEEAAVTSIVGLFQTTRDLMRKNPDADHFQSLAVAMLETIRPYTARWHGLQDSNNRFLGPAQRRQFRDELRKLQEKLHEFASRLQEMGKNGEQGTIPAKPELLKPTLGGDIPMGIDPRHALTSTPSPGASGSLLAAGDPAATLTAEKAFMSMNERELRHVARRRGMVPNPADLIPPEKLRNGTGLALSGGGIRSATFCLGVTQVLAQARLLTKFDYLSTVSGGGYLGSFLSNQFTAEDVLAETAAAADEKLAVDPNLSPAAKSKAEEKVAQNANALATSAAKAFDDVFTGVAADSTKLRHLRNSSKYLLPTTTLARLKLVGLLVSGILATSLLTVVVPVFCAFVVHWFDRGGLLDGTSALPLFGHEIPPFWFVAALAGIAAAVCWVLRPITNIWRRYREGLDSVAAYASILAGVCLIVAATPAALDLLEKLGNWKLTVASITSLTTLVSGAAVIKAIGVVWKYRKAVSRLFILSGGTLFVLVYLVTFQKLQVDASGPPSGSISFTLGKLPITTPELTVFGLLVLWLVWDVFINLNLTGLHRYYRDRLASCYLEVPPTSRDISEPPPLEKLAAKLPYHLINTTVNLASSDNPELRGRGGDFFLLSKNMCGSMITGYQETEQVSRMNPDLDLATAMAVSGAAASTNMGWQTMREYRTLMAIFNVRLGYWMRWRQDTKGRLASNAFIQLAREIFGLLDEKASTLNLSDGGHIENLGAYELIRRKLKFIVCIDGGMDGTMDCADLNRLQRLVAIDLGYRIDFDAADLKLKDSFSSNYGVLVKIDYTPAVEDVEKKQLGWMLYIKLAMLGTESNYVLDYRRENPKFPHQTTANQFFDEAQFEAYRKLGESAAQSFLTKDFAATSPQDFKPWFLRLAGDLLRDTDPVYVKKSDALENPTA